MRVSGMCMVWLFHSGIAGKNILIEDLVVHDFEVAGIQFNGATGVTIRRCTVGPSGSSMVVGSFSSARFIEFFLTRLWKQYWTKEEHAAILYNNTITFSGSRETHTTYPLTLINDTASVSVWDVFKRMVIAQEIFGRLAVKEATGLDIKSVDDQDLDPKDPFDQIFIEANDIYDRQPAVREGYHRLGAIAFNNTKRCVSKKRGPV